MQKRLSKQPRQKLKFIPLQNKIEVDKIVNNVDCSNSIDRVRWSLDQFKNYQDPEKHSVYLNHKMPIKHQPSGV